MAISPIARLGYRIAHRGRSLYRRLLRPVTVGVRVLTWSLDGEVVLVRHAYGIDRWYLPGGAVRRRETFAAAALRELREETGIVARRGEESLVLLGALTTTRDGWTDHVVLFELAGDEWEGPPPGGSRSEIAGVTVVHPSVLPEITSPSTRARIEERLRGEPPGSVW